MPVTYRKLARADLASAHRLSTEVGWPHRFEDWQLVERLGKGHVAEFDGDVVGTVLTWSYGSKYASLGMVIVAPAHQGRGIGGKLMSLALADLEGRTVMLVATPPGKPLYEKLGFVATGTIEQHQGNARHAPAMPLARGERLRPVGKRDEPVLARLATRAAGFSRARTIARLLEVGDAIVLARGSDPIGFALFRRFGRGHAIGPVVAPDPQRAKALIAHWVSMHPGKFLRIDVHELHRLGGWLDSLGLVQVDKGITMVKGSPPVGDDRLCAFALVNQALG